MFCANCRAAAVPSAQFCAACGSTLSNQAQAPSANPASQWQLQELEEREDRLERKERQVESWRDSVSPAASTFGANFASPGTSRTASMEDFYASAIGPKNQQRYLDKFAQFDHAGGPTASWHWPAFFLTFYWLLYRKMWVRAALYLIALPLVLGFVGAILSFIHPMLGNLFSVLSFIGVFVWPAMYADAMYYKKCRQWIEKARSGHESPRSQLATVARKGQTSWIATLAVALLFSVSMIGLMSAVALPAYQDYVVRAKTSQAMIYGEAATHAVDEYYYRTKSLPPRLESVSIGQSRPDAVRDVQWNARNGEITLILAGVSGASRREGPAFLLLSPSVDAGGEVVWSCSSSNIRKSALPPSCRGASGAATI